jgi:Zn-dependent protease/CBS domain-containing protein
MQLMPNPTNTFEEPAYRKDVQHVPSMRWSLRLGSVSGIDIYVHWTFLILLLWILMSYLVQGETLALAARALALITAIFGCVVLHELGHALTAQRFNIQTRDITLLPIGGIARLERIPSNPYEELVVVAAGPAVNLVIAAALFLFLFVTHQFELSVRPYHSFLTQIMWVNISLLVFNLIPAFPMDGGRILRALLAQHMDYLRATQIAARAGQFIAVLFGVWGLVSANPFLVFIAMFVFAGAHQEFEYTQARALLHGISVRSAMITQFQFLQESDMLTTVVEKLLSGMQEDFPVLNGGKVAGVLTRNRIIKALAERGPDIPVGEVMDRACPSVQDNEPLEDTVEKMRESGCTVEPVLHDTELVGLLTLEHINELTEIRSALRRVHT